LRAKIRTPRDQFRRAIALARLKWQGLVSIRSAKKVVKLWYARTVPDSSTKLCDVFSQFATGEFVASIAILWFSLFLNFETCLASGLKIIQILCVVIHCISLLKSHNIGDKIYLGQPNLAWQPSWKKIAKNWKIVNSKALPPPFFEKSGRETLFFFYLALRESIFVANLPLKFVSIYSQSWWMIWRAMWNVDFFLGLMCGP